MTVNCVPTEVGGTRQRQRQRQREGGGSFKEDLVGRRQGDHEQFAPVTVE